MLDAGTRHHERKAVAERVAGGSISLGRLLVAVALVRAPAALAGVAMSVGRLDRRGGGAGPAARPVTGARGPGHAATSRPGQAARPFALER